MANFDRPPTFSERFSILLVMQARGAADAQKSGFEMRKPQCQQRRGFSGDSVMGGRHSRCGFYKE
ncbi:hypothetical protein [Caballeronia catudaia]|uniref:hypothetical protein n=1 Tax=Caballeronia catudaia TaxID=1777136 RepID=UPI00117D252A|nr:hypothetical protein [Caballeronia catudaia]